ncbi:MAG: hypothetical protein IPL61_07335 [Myxococcales bacterium]|nr:hypothetical protein [Myxococcales bacterium]
MSATKKLHPDEKIKADKFGGQMFKVGATAGAVLLGISIALGANKGDHWRHFLHAYLTAWSFVFSICVGSLFFVIVHHLARAKWGIVLRRQAEFITGAFPLVAILGLVFLIPVLAGSEQLYFWNVHQLHDPNHPLHHHMHNKLGWLDPVFFAGRYAFFFAVYIVMSTWFRKQSLASDTEGDNGRAEKQRVWSGLAVLIYSLTTVFAVMDFFMTLQPMWFSTIYSVNYFSGAMLATYCTLALMSMAIQRSGRLQHSITVEHYHDIGKYMFGWTFFWIYTGFSQFMLQWYGNMPEETVWYTYRLFGGWQIVSILVLVGHWAFPYTALVTRWTKRILPLLAFFAVWQLVFHYIDLYWNIMPNQTWTMEAGWNRGPLQGDPEMYKVGFHFMDLTLLFALIGLWLAGVGRSMKGNLVPVNDPTLGACLGFENY